MIILHSQKMIIFRVPKTGSTALQHAIKYSELYVKGIDSIAPEITDSGIQFIHTTPQIAYDAGLITDDMIKDYSMYAVIRKPEDRVMSTFSHIMKTVNVTSARIIRRLETSGVNTLPGIFRLPQSTWFTIDGKHVVTPVLYDNYKEEFSAIFKEKGVELEIPARNVGRQRASVAEVFDDEVRLGLLKAHFQEDFDLYTHALAHDLGDRL